MAVVGLKAARVGRQGVQLSLGKAGTLASAEIRRVYMSTPRRNTASCSRSLWSWSSTGVRFMGEKPRAGIPTCRGDTALLEKKAAFRHPTAWHCPVRE